MQIRRKNVDGKSLIIQYIVGSVRPYLGYCVIKTDTDEEFASLNALSDAELLDRLKAELGEQKLADLQANYT